jgi:hypothetical protein
VTFDIYVTKPCSTAKQIELDFFFLIMFFNRSSLTSRKSKHFGYVCVCVLVGWVGVCVGGGVNVLQFFCFFMRMYVFAFSYECTLTVFLLFHTNVRSHANVRYSTEHILLRLCTLFPHTCEPLCARPPR